VWRGWCLGATLLCVGSTPTLTAQVSGGPWLSVEAHVAPTATLQRPDRPPHWLPPVTSAVLPGIGQFLHGQNRGAVYLAVEGLFLIRFFAFHAEGRRESRQYHDLAFTVARATFQPMTRDTLFEYFEQLGKFLESGPFDTDPGPALVPPLDERTYNGSIWSLARRTFLPDPDSIADVDSEEYQRALEFYRQRAVGPNFQWSWRNAGLEQDLYRQSIRRSDEGFRQATQQLGLLLANHLISAIDALITGRLRNNDQMVDVQAAVLTRSDGRWHALAAVLVRF